MDFMDYLILIGSITFLIWLFWSEYHNKEKHQLAKQKLNSMRNKDKVVATNNKGEVICPRCGSSQIELMKRGWKLTTGFIGSSKSIRVCKKCLHKF